MDLKGQIHSFETFAASDGPGVRFLIFLHDCPLRCAYCHNPDTWASTSAFTATVDEIISKALHYRAYWGKNGGITASGGEPLMQAKFVAALFKRAHEEGINTCLDTSGFLFDETNDDVVSALTLSDTVLLDIKHLDKEKHIELTTESNESIIKCAKFLSEKNVKTWIRHVLVPGVTDDENHLSRLGEFIHTLKNVERLEVLPYHTLGIEKWEKLNLTYRLKNIRAATDDDVARAKKIINLPKFYSARN